MYADLHVRHPFEKYFHENPHTGSRVVPCGQTDRHKKTNCCFFCFANAVKNFKRFTILKDKCPLAFTNV